jgi:hypothetical protein
LTKTKDELFVMWLYRSAMDSGDVEKSFNRYDIGAKAGLQDRAVNAICKLLVQANFIKKTSEDEIRLTTHGEKLAVRLLEEP